MPYPSPGKKESRSAFIERCVQNPVMKKEKPDMNTRLGVCYSQWRRSRGDLRALYNHHPKAPRA